jgi:hypothetical protein
MPSLDIPALREAMLNDEYLITTHAKQRMGQRMATDRDIKYVIAEGQVIEQFPRAKPHPKVLFVAPVKGIPLYVSCSFDGNCVFIITVYWHDPKRWTNPWTRRKT